MKRWIGAVVVVTLWPGVAGGQSLSGRYVYQSPNGPVTLVLEQDAANRVTGSMQGTDGGVFELQGSIDEEGRAIGTISIGGGEGWFAAGIVEGRLLMAVAEIDPSTGQPDLENGWSLDFDRVDGGAAGQGGAGALGGALAGALGGARPPAAGGGGAGGGMVGQGGAMGVTENSPLVQQWVQHLSGKRVTYMDSYYSSDIRGYGGYSDRWDAYICSDGTFYFQQNSDLSASSGGVTGISAGGGGMQGSWRVVEQMGQVIFQYQLADGTSNYGVLGFQNGETYFDGERVYVTNENPYCR